MVDALMHLVNNGIEFLVNEDFERFLILLLAKLIILIEPQVREPAA